MNHKNYLLDVTIVHPTAPSTLNHSQKVLGQAEVSEKLKINKYEQISHFIPTVYKYQLFISNQIQILTYSHMYTYAHKHSIHNCLCTITKHTKSISITS